MELIKPFRGMLPNQKHVADMIAPPYDVLSRAAAKAFASSPWNMLHLTRAEIDCDEDTAAFEDVVYSQAKDNWHRFLSQHIFTADAHDSYYVYRIEAGKHVQTGLVSLISLQAYYQKRIRTHEHTASHTEFDRVRVAKTLNAQVSPALLAYREGTFITETLAHCTANTKPVLDKINYNGELHSLWRIADPHIVAKLTDAVRDLGYLYLADGHHRVAAMSRVAFEHPNESAYQYVLGVLFPEAQLKTQAYHRLITDLNGMTHSELVENLTKDFKVETRSRAVLPTQAYQFGLYLQQQWYRLTALDQQPSTIPVTRLADTISKPFFDIITKYHFNNLKNLK